MIDVYVWNASGSASVGHASMRITGGQPEGMVYISWWPTDARVFRATIGTPAIAQRTLHSDLSDEGESPQHMIKITRLNETAIKSWWNQWLRNPNYYLLTRNCSTTVVRALEAGGAGEYIDWGDQPPAIITPADVLQFARAVNRGMANTPMYGRSEGFRRAHQRMNETF